MFLLVFKDNFNDDDADVLHNDADVFYTKNHDDHIAVVGEEQQSRAREELTLSDAVGFYILDTHADDGCTISENDVSHDLEILDVLHKRKDVYHTNFLSDHGEVSRAQMQHFLIKKYLINLQMPIS
jgi:hypothetical protein